jgi:hypothetical protein
LELSGRLRLECYCRVVEPRSLRILLKLMILLSLFK